MSQSATWDTLQVARDARLSGRPDVEAALLVEVGPDFDYVRRSAAVRARHRGNSRFVEWMAWVDPDRRWLREYHGEWLAPMPRGIPFL